MRLGRKRISVRISFVKILKNLFEPSEDAEVSSRNIELRWVYPNVLHQTLHLGNKYSLMKIVTLNNGFKLRGKRNIKYQISNIKYQIWNMEYGIWDIEYNSGKNHLLRIGKRTAE